MNDTVKSANKNTVDANAITHKAGADICRPGIGLYATFCEKVAEFHTSKAIATSGMAISYGDLKSSVDTLSSSLAKLGVRSGSSIVIRLNDTANAVILSLAALKLNAILTPLTDNACEKEIVELVSDADTYVVYDSAESMSYFGEKAVAFNRLLTVDGDLPVSSKGVADEDVIYCSYHLGRKKLISQARLKTYLNWFNGKYPVAKGDVILHKVTEDAMHSIVEILWPLLTGATIAVYKERDTGSQLPAFIKQHAVTHAHFTPTELNKLISQQRGNGMLASLKLVFCSGELLSQSIVNRFMQVCCDEVKLVKLFNNPETPEAIAYVECSHGEDQDFVSKARPMSSDVLVLDNNLSQVPHGAVGKIFVRQVAA